MTVWDILQIPLLPPPLISPQVNPGAAPKVDSNLPRHSLHPEKPHVQVPDLVLKVGLQGSVHRGRA